MATATKKPIENDKVEADDLLSAATEEMLDDTESISVDRRV